MCRSVSTRSGWNSAKSGIASRGSVVQRHSRPPKISSMRSSRRTFEGSSSTTRILAGGRVMRDMRCGGANGSVRWTRIEKAIDMPSRMRDLAATPSPGPSQGKGAAVRRLFGAIARRYDLANHLLSGGLDFWWRRRAAAIVRSWKPAAMLDLATGSGDLALALSRACPDASVLGADFCLPMLLAARRKGVAKLIQADGMQLPLPDAAFDAVTIAFGLRNMESWQRGLAEIARVLRPGGH